MTSSFAGKLKAGMERKRNDGISHWMSGWCIPSLRCAPFRLVFYFPNLEQKRKPHTPHSTLHTPHSRHNAFTLLEVLIVMGLLVVIFGAVWGIIEMFTKSFIRGEIRSERSQLVRSLSTLVTDDLGCAIQDPLHPARESNVNAVRRFGLSGTNTSMRIDVLQINPFRPGSTTVQYGVQAPELKTVYYDYALLSANGGGLTRRELDFETPTGLPGQQNANNANLPSGDDSEDFAPLSAIGSDGASLSDFGGASLADTVSSANRTNPQQQQMAMMMPPEMAAANAAARYAANEKLQLEMSAPEVVGCWFRYYDGSQWRDDWNSLNRRGLPVAIEITLKMMPHTEAQKLRTSPWAAQVVNGPGISTIIGLQASDFSLQGGGGFGLQTSDFGVQTPGFPEARSLKPEASSLSDLGAPTTMTDLVAQQNMMRNQPVGLTVEQLAEQLDLLPPTEQRIVIRVPTTPLTSQQELQRSQPTVQPQAAQTAPRQQAQRSQAQRSVAQPRRAATAPQRRQPTGNRQSTSPDWIRQ